MSNDYIIYRIVIGSRYFTTPKFYAEGEISKFTTLFPEEKIKILESAKSFQINFIEELGQVISVIVKGTNYTQALRESETKFDESLDILSKDFYSYIKCEISEAGIIKNLESLEIHTIKREDYNFNQSREAIGSVFETKANEFEKPNIYQLIYEFKHRNIVKAFLRSIHYYRLAKKESNIIYKFLSYWMSFEAISRTTKEDNIKQKLLFSLNIFTGKKYKNLNQTILKKMSVHPDFKLISKIVKKSIPTLISTRNSIVHNGFNANDINNQEIRKYCILLHFGISRLQNLCKESIIDNDINLSNFWEKIEIYFNRIEKINTYFENTGYPYLKGTQIYNNLNF
ncbi:hypothetical protein [Leptospira bandrabouensis]|uniref:hypothetical protein n=1 Tax=Leptospira bandrabouensis TaxID=2484903 RepID=UPI001EE7E6E6|nr:hypothetical protein [Leptospira bandrabouensis]MCG6146572.1 hypothetical protein [Leptospira bandrabouensis]MCG6161977.1 hypothetical protein [Leptospira bandrabouensis]MCG6166161.1 hypothetical protein [Leptospira bandrabouensis]